MSVIDRFLSAMKMNDDDLPDDEYLDDEYDEDSEDYEEDRPKRRLLNRPKKEKDDQDSSDSKTVSKQSDMTSSRTTKVRQKSSSKISPMRTTGSSRRSGMEVYVIRPKSMEDAREVTETLLDECTVILNMEGIDYDLAQRIIDFACGSCYAIHGNLQKVSNYIFIITPASVDISGDVQNMIGGAYDVPNFDSDF